MTHNQIQAQANVENARANRAKEAESRRTNIANESIKTKGNELTHRGQDLKFAGDVVKSVASRLNNLNHPIWYKGNEQLAKDSANWSFGAPLGSSMSVSATNKSVVPGIGVIKLRNTIGGESYNAVASPINTAAKVIYSFIRHANSGSVNYEAPDMMVYILGVCDVVGQICELTRLYSLLNTAKGENRYYNKALIEAAGFNYNDMILHINDLRSFINVAVVRANSLYIPAAMPLFERKTWLYSGIFKDAPVHKSQDYIFVNEGYLKYDPGIESTGSKLVFTAKPNSGEGFNQVTTRIQEQLDALLSDEDIGIMSGDILKAYGSSGIYTLGLINESYHIESLWDEMIAMQIHNATCVGQAYDSRDWDITQSTDGLLQMGSGSTIRISLENIHNEPVTGGYTVQAGVDQSLLGIDHLLCNLDTDNASIDMILEATRLMTTLTPRIETAGSTPRSVLDIQQFGTEVATTFVIYKLNLTTGGLTSYNFYHNLISDKTTDTIQSVLEAISAYNSFDWAPQVQWVKITISGSVISSASFGGHLFDVQNYKVVTTDDLSKVHNAAILSLFGVEKLGQAARDKFYR